MKDPEDREACKYEEVLSVVDVAPRSVSAWYGCLIQSPYWAGKDNIKERSWSERRTKEFDWQSLKDR